MRKFLLLLGMTFLFLHLSSQTYHHFPDSSATWTVLYEYQSSPTNYYNRMDTYSLGGDTTFNNIAYHKIFCNGGYFGAIREDTLQKSIYYHGNYNFHFANDTLLYQFGLNAGDSIPIKFPIPKTNQIISIDSVSIAGRYRKRYNMDPPDKWIEGIGSTKFLFFPFDYTFEWNWTLVCYSESGQQLYKQDYFDYSIYKWKDGCSGEILGINEVLRDQVLVFPNPTSQKLNVSVNNESETIQLSLYEISGKQVFSSIVLHTSEIDLSDFDNGVYTLSIRSNNFITNKKLIVQK
ncbi:MAG: T9SS type A sorting domain-containing protein [Bacteroidia bacterium]